MSEEQSSDLVRALVAAGDLLRRAVPEGEQTAPALGTADLSMLGGALDEVTRALANIAIGCAAQVGQLPFGHVLSDDSGTHNPAARCAEAADELHQVAQHLDAANQSAWQFHNAISHITVDATRE
jgi:hypothetical protein